MFLRGDDEAAQRMPNGSRWWRPAVTFLVSLFMLFQFDPSNTDFQFVEERDWLLGLKYKMGVDGISVLFVMLTTFMMPLTILRQLGCDAPGQGIHDRVPAAGNADAGRVHARWIWCCSTCSSKAA